MAAGDSPSDPAVIVVGERNEAFVVEAVQLARQYELEPMRCDDVYSAAAILARANRCVAVIGRFGDMTREDGAVFHLAHRAGAQCCCLLNEDIAAEREKILGAVRQGVHLVGETEEVGDFLEGCLAGGPFASRHDDGLKGKDCRVTKAELEALLEQETDG